MKSKKPDEHTKNYRGENETLTVFYRGENWDRAIDEPIRKLNRSDFKVIIAFSKQEVEKYINERSRHEEN
jgi:hypothetical protein